MSWWRAQPKDQQASAVSDVEQRLEPRIRGYFKVRYSGFEANTIVVGHGVVMDLSLHGFGIQGEGGLTPGMELALFLEVPDLASPMCIPQAIVTWVNGRRFGVKLNAARAKHPEWLDHLSFS